MGWFTPQGVSYEEYQLVLDELAEAKSEYEIRLDALDAELAHYEQVIAERQPTEWLEAVMTKRIIVHVASDNLTFEGSLVAKMDDGILLRAARLLSDEGKPTALAGETWIAKEKITFAQHDG